MPNPRRTINRLKDPRDLWLFIQVLSTLILLPRRIRSESLPGLLSKMDPGVHHLTGSPETLNKTVGFVDTLLSYRFFQKYGKCLMRSLALYKLLRHQGWPVEIHFGVRRTEDGNHDITGHSWLVLSGEPFLESDFQEFTFTTTYSHPT